MELDVECSIFWGVIIHIRSALISHVIEIWTLESYRDQIITIITGNVILGKGLGPKDQMVYISAPLNSTYHWLIN
jgi:hypothetical protein